ncbi:hypothetical protein JTB14_020627 [Gonioctena quinquepunctata]|nr:hypothetical protein JTB14_020627 [Gonioctena quinquepunctata]
MDINWTCPSYKCNIMELLPFFLDVTDDDEILNIPPSRLLHEMQLSVEERLEQLSKPTRRRRSSTKMNAFSRTPDIIVFQNFKPNKIYKTTLTLQNLKPVSKHLSIENNTSPYFDISSLSDSLPIKVAPGMTYTVQIMFKPLELRDYTHHVNFMADGETFSVPINAIGNRAVVNIPDNITLKPTAIRVPTEKRVILYNFGNVQANYVVGYKEPFEVFPVRGALKPNQTGELKITYTPKCLATSESEIYLMYDDVKLRIPVTCDIVETNVYLDTHAILFGEVYMGLQSPKTVTLHNQSPFILDFCWKAYKTNALEMLERAKLLQAMKDMTELQKTKYVKLDYMNIIDGEGHSHILDKNLEEESDLSEDPYLYKSQIFSILPMEGRIVPNQSLDFMITFKPPKSDYYTSMAYLDLTGKDERLPMSLAGGGKGPQVVFNVTTLNIDNIFINAIHEYQIVAKNNGLIPATVVFKEKSTDFGGTIKCAPKKQYLKYCEVCKSFIISFRSAIEGRFVEKIEFYIQGSKEILNFLMVGNVVCPLLRPTVKEIDFGNVSSGVKPSREFILHNDSQVPVDFKLIVSGKNRISLDLVEFDVYPEEGVVEAFSSTPIKVALTTEAVQEVEEHLIIVMWGAHQYSTTITLKYNCVCPDIECTPSEVIINFCFLNYEYKRTITLRNTSKNHGYITYTPIREPKNMTCVLHETEAMIFPDEDINIHLSIQTNILGYNKYPLTFTLSGDKPRTLCTIICNGQGPVVSYFPDDVNFGKTKLLQKVSKTLSLVNESPIRANIRISIEPFMSSFVSNVEELEIAPEDKTDITISCYLRDTGKYKNHLNIEIENGETMTVTISAEGIGSSILCEPSLESEYDAGILLTYRQFKLPVKFTNMGKKFYKILWTRRQSVKNVKEISGGDDDSQANFRMKPNYFELGYNESITIEIIGLSKKPKLVQEAFHCYAAIDKSSRVENIMSCFIKAEFVDPLVKCSRYNMNFLSMTEIYPFLPDDYDMGSSISIKVDTVVITNETPLPLAVDFKTTGDFYIIDGKCELSLLHMELDAHEEYNAMIEFKPGLISKRYTKKEGRLMIDICDHPTTNSVDLAGEVCFPTVKLHPDKYDFGCIPPGSYSFAKIILQNTTFLPATFTWELLEEYLEIEELQEAEIKQEKHVELQTPALVAASTKSTITQFYKSRPSLGYHQSESGLVPRAESVHAQKEWKKMPYMRVEKSFKSISMSDELHSVATLGEKHVEATVEWSHDRFEMEANKIMKDLVDEFVTIEDTDDSFFLEEKLSEKLPLLGNIVKIEPSRGYLEPYEYIVVTVGFFPPPNVKIKCTATCNVQEGEKEHLVLTGVSANISYKLNKEHIEFGRKLFCEVCQETFRLKNDGLADFNFKDITEDKFATDFTLTPGWFSLSPNKIFLRAGKSVEFTVKYFPGRTGEFTKDIIIGIGYLAPIKISLHGYAIFSQLVMSLPRPSIQKYSRNLTYAAVTSITEEYLLLLNKIESENTTKYVARTSIPEYITEVMYSELLKDGWVVISEQDIYPTTLEIDLAIERLLLNEHIAERIDILTEHTVTCKIDRIPEFTVPAYLLDFGYVILNQPVCYTVLIMNSGSVTIAVKKKESFSRLDENEIKIEFKTRKLEVGQMAELFVIFGPTDRKFGQEEKCIKERFHLKVNHGAIVPIIIRATVTRPSIRIKHCCIDFGAIKFGTVLRRAIIIENDGYLLSKWSAEVESPNSKIPKAYWITHKNGELQPGRKDLLHIYFRPTKARFYNSLITLRVEGNEIITELELCGHGVEATLVFSEKDLNFKNTLPYTQDNIKQFLVQNVSTFPIEFCFPDLDPDYDDEKCHTELYLDAYNLETILIPEIKLGSQLRLRSPNVFQTNYYSLLSRLKQSMKIDEEAGDTDFESSPDPLAEHTKEEIFELMKAQLDEVNDEIDDTKTDFRLMEDDSDTRIAVIEPEKSNIVEQSDTKNGVFIIFHGSPVTDYFKAANKTGHTLSMAVYSIDRLICEELVENMSGPALDINSIIDKYMTTNKIEVVKNPGEDDYDMLLKKMDRISYNMLKKNRSKVSPNKKHKSEGSDKKNSGKPPAGIPFELITLLLKKKFESLAAGVIIESLNSEFLPQLDVALDCLLRAIGNVKFIQVVLLSHTLEEYVRDEEIKQILKERAKGTSSARSSARSRQKIDRAQEIMKNMSKDLKRKFELFSKFLQEVIPTCEFWDRRYQGSLKSQNSRMTIVGRMDAKTTRDSTKESRASTKNTTTNIHKVVDGDSQGVPLWIFNSCGNKKISLEVLSFLLKNNQELNEAIRELNRGANDIQVEESETMFSVVKRSKRKRKILSDRFRIMSVNEIDQQVSHEGNITRRKFLKRKYSTERRGDSVSLSSVKENYKSSVQPRSILQPGDIMKYQVVFLPSTCGKFRHTYTMTVLGSDTKHSIVCNASCELPSIDFTPEKVFPKCRESYRYKTLADRFTFFKEDNVFEFGSIVTGTNKSEPYKTTLTLRNQTDLLCVTSAELDENSLFIIEPENFLIEPRGSFNLTLSLKTPKKGIVDGEMFISVKNNPQVHSFRLLANACNLEFHVHPKLELFDKVPIGYSMWKTINLSNSSPIDLFWKLGKSEKAHEVYTFSKTSGNIGLYSVDEIVVEYSPQKEETNPKKNIEILIFDLLHSDTLPLHTETVALQSDAVEYIVEYEDHIDLGLMRCNINYKVPFQLVNKGNCTVTVVFSMLENILPGDKHLIRRFFKMNSQQETLLPLKTNIVMFQFYPTEEVNFSKLPAFQCSFVEMERPQNIIRSFIVTLSGEVHSSRFVLCPTSEMHFAYQQICSTKSQILKIKNIGKIAFEYKIVSLEKLLKEQLKSASQLKGDKSKTEMSRKTSSRKSDKESSEKGKLKDKKSSRESKLEVRGFSLHPSTGTVEPDQTTQIIVECTPTELRHYEEVVVIKVSEPQVKDIDGRKMTLHADGSEPSLNFVNIQKMFREHFIVEEMEHFKSTENIGGHSIFVKSENALHFKNVYVDEKFGKKLYLQNLGKVVANVSMQLADSKGIFQVSPNAISIEPYATEYINIIFHPDSINVFENKLEISYNSSTNDTFSFLLIGESCVPQIKLLKPNVDENNYATLEFSPTYIDSSQSREIQIENVGVIPCKVILDLGDHHRETFTLEPRDDTAHLLNVISPKDSESTKYSTLVNLLTSQKANFDLIFCPKSQCTTNMRMKIHTVNNPFEIINIDIIAHGYNTDIYIEELPTFNYDKPSLTKTSVGYLLDFGYTSLNRLEKKCFTIRNSSTIENYKFEFTDVENLTLTPKVGHLKPLSYKEIIATVSTRKPICSEKIRVECKFVRIEYLDSEAGDIPWDDRQQLVPWRTSESKEHVSSARNQYFRMAIDTAKKDILGSMEFLESEQNKRKCIMDRSEPAIRLLSKAWDTIPILHSIIADYGTYECTVRELILPDTYVNQKNEVNFVVRNTGLIPLQIEWALTCDEILPKNASSTSLNNPKSVLLAPAPSLESPVSWTTLFSSEVSLSGEILPFEIIPKNIAIAPGKTETMRLVFTPKLASQYYLRLISNILSLEPHLSNMDISVTADSILPNCYFEADGKEIVSEKAAFEGTDHAETVKVIELISVGIGTISRKKFNVVNTSSDPLAFTLESLETDRQFTFFHCETPSGRVQPGKKFEISFSFKPQKLGMFQARYFFHSSSFNSYFILTGNCREPKVSFTKVHVDINATLLKIQTQESVVLRNEEDMELNFKFIKSSLFSEDQEQQLKVLPFSGAIPSKRDVVIKLIYGGDKVGEYNFDLKCIVQKMKNPLNLCVTAKCTEVMTSVTYIDRNGHEIVLDPKTENLIDLGNIGIKIPKKLKLHISNKGETGFFYAWNFNKKPVEHALNIFLGNEKGFVPIGETFSAVFTIEACKRYVLKDFKIKLEISYGSTYMLKLNAVAALAMCRFSFTNYNFGCCLVQKSCSKYYNTVLEVKNIDSKPIMLENNFQNTDDLTVDFNSARVMPNSLVTIPIYFHPRKVGKYEFPLPVLVDSSNWPLKINGEGVELNIQLVNPNDKFIHFDAVKLGVTKKHALQIINKSLTRVDIRLNLLEHFQDRAKDQKISLEMEVPDLVNLKLTKSKKPGNIVSDKNTQSKKGTNIELVDKEAEKNPNKDVSDQALPNISELLKIHPKGFVSLDSCKKSGFVVEFRPTESIGKFAEKIYYQVQEYLEPLCIVKGSSKTSEFSLDKHMLTFANVIVGCQQVLSVLLKNTGGTKGRFKWTMEDFSDEFSIHPIDGFITPKSDMIIWISFKPKTVHCDIFKKAKCVVDSGVTMELQVMANSADLPQPLGTVNFSCPVRTTATQPITIRNNTKTRWCLNPVVSNKQFSAPTEIMVEPESSSVVQIEYTPEKMIGRDADKGTLFIPLPEGQAIIYDLIGEALPPLPMDKFTLDIWCKQDHTETLTVGNWLDVKQCFEVRTELVSQSTAKTIYKAFGQNVIEVPPNSSKSYRWNLYVMNEEQLDFKVVFTNIETGEYMFYELSVKVLPSGPLDTITMAARVREQVTSIIKLKNPIDMPVKFNISGGVPETRFQKIVSMEPYTTHDLVICYIPLEMGETKTNIEAKCEELGVFTYELILKGTPPLLEKVLRFKAELGEKGYNSIHMKNTFSSTLELTGKFDHLAFSADKYVPIPVGETGKFTIKFEPVNWEFWKVKL